MGCFHTAQRELKTLFSSEAGWWTLTDRAAFERRRGERKPWRGCCDVQPQASKVKETMQESVCDSGTWCEPLISAADCTAVNTLWLSMWQGLWQCKEIYCKNDQIWCHKRTCFDMCHCSSFNATKIKIKVEKDQLWSSIMCIHNADLIILSSI